jgi:uncharacterized protein YjbI with pentapeptide repeats
MLGIHLKDSRSLSCHAHVSNSVLDYSSFFERNIKKFQFEQCSLQHVDFERANLQQALFKKTNLLNARFVQCNLEGCDFRSSINIQLDPEVNRMKKSKFGPEQLPGLLLKYQLIID